MLCKVCNFGHRRHYSTDHGKVNVNQLKVNALGLTFHWKKLQIKSERLTVNS